MSYYSEHQAMYKRKLVTADYAVSTIEDGSKIHFGTGAGVVDALDKALAKRVPDLFGTQVYYTVAIRDNMFCHRVPS